MPTVTVPERTYQPGTYDVNVSGLTADAKGARVTVTRTASLEALEGVVARCAVVSSFDGVTWTPIREITISGGTVTGKDGRPLVESWFQFEWPGVWVDGVRVPQRKTRVRVRVTVEQPVRTAITLASLGD